MLLKKLTAAGLFILRVFKLFSQANNYAAHNHFHKVTRLTRRKFSINFQLQNTHASHCSTHYYLKDNMWVFQNVSPDQSLINLQLLFYFFADLERLKELSWQVRNPRMYQRHCTVSWRRVLREITQKRIAHLLVSEELLLVNLINIQELLVLVYIIYPIQHILKFSVFDFWQ